MRDPRDLSGFRPARYEVALAARQIGPVHLRASLPAHDTARQSGGVQTQEPSVTVSAESIASHTEELGLMKPAPAERVRQLKAGDRIIVCGAGPAGLTAAYQLAKQGYQVTVLEADSVVGGISRTARY